MSAGRVGKSKRQLDILKKLYIDEWVVIAELAEQFKVGPGVIRRDLAELENSMPGLIRRLRGGAVLLPREWPYSRCFFGQVMTRNYEAKQLISEYVVSNLIPIGAALAIDIGTTMTVFSRELSRSNLAGMRVASHSLSVPIEILDSPVITSYTQFGETLYGNEAALLPPPGEPIPSEWQPFQEPYIAIMTAEGFSMERGAAVTDARIARLDQLNMAHAGSIIMLLDHSKFSKKAHATTTMCGLAPEKTDWLPERKPFRLVINFGWDEGNEPKEYKELAKRIPPRIPEDEEFASIRIFESTLLPKAQQRN